jgi:predicted transcriptional regulator
MKINKADPTSIRFSVKAKKLLEKLSEKLNITKPSILELAIRDYAEKNGIEVNDG